MILVDTNVIIDFWKNPTQDVQQVFITQKVAVCGIVKAELIHGARSEEDIRKINEALSGFHYLIIHDSIWDGFALILYRLKKNGITLPFQDAFLAALSIQADAEIWSNDRHFQLIQRVIPELKRFILK